MLARNIKTMAKGRLLNEELLIANNDKHIPKDIAPVLSIVPLPIDLLSLAVINVPAIPPTPEIACK